MCAGPGSSSPLSPRAAAATANIMSHPHTQSQSSSCSSDIWRKVSPLFWFWWLLPRRRTKLIQVQWLNNGWAGLILPSTHYNVRYRLETGDWETILFPGHKQTYSRLICLLLRILNCWASNLISQQLKQFILWLFYEIRWPIEDHKPLYKSKIFSNFKY